VGLNLVLNAIRLALGAIARNKARAALTVLGILIGVAAVVAVTALGASATSLVAGEIDSIGTNVLFVFPQPTQSSGARSKVTGRITENDGRAIVRESVSVAAVAPYLETVSQVIYGDKNVSTQLIGTTLAYFPIRKFKPGTGELWSESDETLKTKVCLLGPTVAEKLFGVGEDPAGKIVRIGRAPYRVLGVLAKRGSSPFGEDEDDRIMMPIGSFRARVLRTAPGRADYLIAASTSEQTTDRAQQQITAILRQRHKIDGERDSDFVVRTQAEFREKQEAITTALYILLISVAGVSLLVGGIGVMNIMLVSVAERTREIGTRLSIGARENDILTQFLVEAVVLSLVGGLLGMMLGVGGTMTLGHVLDWPIAPSPIALLVAVGTSGAIGVTFGYLPARRAAKMDPIDALRTD
jgi:putative ABC transport system permease protein